MWSRSRYPPAWYPAETCPSRSRRPSTTNSCSATRRNWWFSSAQNEGRFRPALDQSERALDQLVRKSGKFLRRIALVIPGKDAGVHQAAIFEFDVIFVRARGEDPAGAAERNFHDLARSVLIGDPLSRLWRREVGSIQTPRIVTGCGAGGSSERWDKRGLGLLSLCGPRSNHRRSRDRGRHRSRSRG